MARTQLAPLLALLALSCGPTPKEGTAQVMALVLNASGVYETRQVELKYLQDVVALQGDAATLVGGARIVVDPADPLLRTNSGKLSDAQLLEIFTKSAGSAPRASYVDKAGVLWPADFHTWNMVSTYYNFQRAFDYWAGLYSGKDTSDLKGSRVLYFPAFTLTEASPHPQTDNALFFPPIQAFAILPFERLQTVPLSINAGVVAHEFAHRVFNRKVYGGASLPEPLLRWTGITATSPGINLLKSLDEGLADFHAVGATCVSGTGCDTRFLQGSLGTPVTDARDISRDDQCMTQALKGAMTTLSVNDFTRQGLDYKVGTLLATSLYQAAMKAGAGKLELLQKSVLAAYSDTGLHRGYAEQIAQNIDQPQNFTLSTALDTILAHITDDELQKLTCNEFLGRMQMQNECPTLPCLALPNCPPASTPTGSCKPDQ